jgi:hypothetical protein
MGEIIAFILGAIWAVACPIIIWIMIRMSPWTKDDYEVDMESKKLGSLTAALMIQWFVNILLLSILAYSWKVWIWDNIF